MSLATAIAAARSATQSALEDGHAGTVTINAVNYEGSVVADKIKRVETSQGWQTQQTIYVTLRKSLLATEPALGGKLTYSNQVYDIEDVGGTKSDEIAWTFTCRRWLKR